MIRSTPIVEKNSSEDIQTALKTRFQENWLYSFNPTLNSLCNGRFALTCTRDSVSRVARVARAVERAFVIGAVGIQVAVVMVVLVNRVQVTWDALVNIYEKKYIVYTPAFDVSYAR